MTKARDLASNSTGSKPTLVDAKGDLLVGTAADTAGRLAVGSADQVLTVDSSTGTGLKWATPSSGGMTSIASGNLTGASVTISSIPGTYKNLQLVLRDWYPSANNEEVQVRPNSDSGGNYLVTGVRGNTSAAASSLYLAQNLNINVPIPCDDADRSNIAVLTFFSYTNTTIWKICSMNAASYADGGASYSFDGNGLWRDTSAISSLYLYLSGAATFSGGTYELFGVK